MTTRRLVLIRHAKATDGAADADRTLAARGELDAVAIGDWLAARAVVPDLVVVSPAVRAQQTWVGACQAFVEPIPMVIDDRIYDNTVTDLLDVIHDTPDAVQTLTLVGHNPAMGALALALADSYSAQDLLDGLGQGFPTSATAVFTVSQAWADVAADSATLVHYAAQRG